MKRIVIGFIKIYQGLLSPLMGQNCRFHPTCSTYMVQAIENQGVIKGLWLGCRRLLKCQPYYKGDFLDPVPEKHKSKKPHAKKL